MPLIGACHKKTHILETKAKNLRQKRRRENGEYMEEQNTKTQEIWKEKSTEITYWHWNLLLYIHPADQSSGKIALGDPTQEGDNNDNHCMIL